MSEMAVTGLAPWFGGKRELAERIVAELGPHRFYVEPLCGSMATLLAKPPCSMEIVNDLHGDLINLARVVQHADLGPSLYRRLRRVLTIDGEHEEARRRLAEMPAPETGAAPDIERAYWWFIDSWLGRNGCAGTSSSNNGFCRRFTAGGGSASVRMMSAVASIPAWRHRMRRVTVLRMDAMELLASLEDGEHVAIYCDPPYIAKGARYVHDFAAGDHARLAEALRRFRRTRVVVSYYDHPRVRELYQGWTVVDCPVTKSLVNQGMRDRGGVVTAPEVLLINGPSLTDGLDAMPLFDGMDERNRGRGEDRETDPTRRIGPAGFFAPAETPVVGGVSLE